MRLLFVSHTFPLPGQALSNVGGMQRVAVEQRAALERIPEVELSSIVLESSSRWTGIRTVPFLLGLLREIPRRVKRDRIDAVLFSSMVTASAALPLRRLLARNGITTGVIPLGLDVTLPNPAYQRLVPRVFGALDLLFPISRATADACLTRGARPGQILVVPCGADPSRFSDPTDRAAGRRALVEALRELGEPALPEGAKLLFSVGRHQERKGFHWFIDQVMPRLPDDVVYLLGGTGPMTPVIRQAVARHRLEGRVRILGRLAEDTLATCYRGAELFIMPNIPVPGDMEGFGVVMLEAGLSGLPVLAANIEGIRDVVEPGQNGELLPAQEVGAWVAALSRALENGDSRDEAAARARRFTSEHFSWDAIAGQFIDGFLKSSKTKNVRK